MRITRRQLRRIIKEAIEGPDGVWYDDHGNPLQPDDLQRLVDENAYDLVHKVDYRGDGRGGDYKKTVGDEIGQVIEIDKDPDGAQYTVLFPDGSTIMDTGDSFEAAK
jgi:predicted RNase H-like HicB family nuclease